MANDNNKNNVVSPVDDDPTAEFEIPAGLRQAADAHPPEIELHENTYDIEDRDAEYRQMSKTALKQALRSGQDRIDELEFELEQLRSQHRGALEELRARRDIADTLGTEKKDAEVRATATEARLREAREELDVLRPALDNTGERVSQLDEQNRQLRAEAAENDRRITSLKQQLDEQDECMRALQSDLHEARLTSESARNVENESAQRIAELEQALREAREETAELKSHVDRRQPDREAHEDEVAALRETVIADDATSTGISKEVAALKKDLEDKEAALHNAVQRLKQERATSKSLRRENRKLSSALHEESGKELQQSRDRLAAQAGQIAGLRRDVAELRKDNARFQEYADSLRIQLQDQIAIAKISGAMRRKLEIGLDRADSRIAELTSALETARQGEEEFDSRLRELQEQHETELRQVRFELRAAQETIADQETINEQLESDLVDHQGFRQALENQLDETARRNQTSMRMLQEELERARKDAEELDRKIRMKDSAISDLMRELAEYSSKIEVRSDTGLQGIDGFASRQNRGQRGDKITRQLIGSADGRELRFPLFKDRLTIGRTSHNDIQLNMQFVSRRHAVIATDHGATRVIDWGSKNGVYVNRERVTERILTTGDIVTIGTTDFRYEEHTKK